MEVVALCIALAFIIYSIPEALVKLALIWDELRTYGPTRAFTLALKMVVSCLKCCTFWTTLAIAGSFTLAGCLAFGAHILNRHN